VQILTHEGDVTGSSCSETQAKIWKNRLRVFKRKFAKNGILNFAFRLNQSSGITF